MSPHVNNFVTDLVEMAKAMDELPKVQADLKITQRDLELVTQSVQSRELHIIELKAEVEKHLSTIRSLEVARDDAELRFLEADDKIANILAMAKASSVSLGQMIGLIDPVKAQPETVIVPITEQGQSASSPTPNATVGEPKLEQTSAISSATTDAISGQSESLPTVGKLEDVIPLNAVSSQEPVVSGQSVDNPSNGPYSGLRYYDMPTWISPSDWLAGGGTQENYDWRPERQSQW